MSGAGKGVRTLLTSFGNLGTLLAARRDFLPILVAAITSKEEQAETSDQTEGKRGSRARLLKVAPAPCRDYYCSSEHGRCSRGFSPHYSPPAVSLHPPFAGSSRNPLLRPAPHSFPQHQHHQRSTSTLCHHGLIVCRKLCDGLTPTSRWRGWTSR